MGSAIQNTSFEVNPDMQHAALQGLTADDHVQYLLLAGRSGGQSVYGGTGASNNLTFSSTSHATKGSILLNGKVGILEGGSSPVHHTFFQGGDQSADVTYTLPGADGVSGAFLSTDGSGNLSWGVTSNVIQVKNASDVATDVGYFTGNEAVPVRTKTGETVEVTGSVTGTFTGTVTGTVTANAGTNLNTSLLALESGGNLASIAGKDFATQTTLAALNAKFVTGTDIGDVTINNSVGGAAVNIQDGGNTITVDGSVTVSGSVTAAQGGAPWTFDLTQYGSVAVGVGNAVHVQPGTAATWDVSDRAARLVGVVYGSQGQLAQRTTSLDAFVQLRTAGTEYDARSIRALTSSDTVTAVQATGSNLHTVLDSGTLTSITNPVAVTGTFWQATQPVSIASGQVASGAFASGSIASGAIASGAVASGAVASGAFASGSVSDGAVVTLGALADAKSTATDITPVSAISILKEISYMEQTPASRAVTNAGTFAVQATLAAETTKVIGTVNQGTSPWVVSGAVTVTSGSITADTELPAAATIAADGVTPTVPGIAAYSFVKTPGANTWDRWYAVVNATNSTGIGVGAVGILAQFDDTTPTAITENQFGNVRMSSLRALLVGGEALDDAAFTIGVMRPIGCGFLADETATDSVDEGDVGIARMTLDRRQITSSENTDDAAWSASGKVSVFAGVVDDDAVDAADEGDVAYVRVSTRRALYVEGQTAADAAIAASPITVGLRASYASPSAMSADGDVVNAWGLRGGALVVSPPVGTNSTATLDLTNASTVYRFTTSSTWVANLRVQAKSTNVGTVTYGTSATFASNYMELRPGSRTPPFGGTVDLATLYFGSSFAGDDVVCEYTAL